MMKKVRENRATAITAGLLAVAGLNRFSKERNRRTRLAGLAKSNGWRYSRRRNTDLAHDFAFLNHLSDGVDRHVTDLILGHHKNWPIVAFSHYGGPKLIGSNNVGWSAVAALQLPTQYGYPELTVTPKSWSSSLPLEAKREITFPDFPDFGRHYQVTAASSILARDILSETMIGYLLQHRRTAFEIEGRWLAAVEPGKLRSFELRRQINRLTGLALRLPPVMQSD